MNINSLEEETIQKLDFAKQKGLLPVIVQEVQTKDVLMLAYVNETALQQTQKTGQAHYYSRSRQTIWRKGESSGNLQIVQEIRVDCDQDTVLYLVEQQGNGACHTGRTHCFYRKLEGTRLEQIEESSECMSQARSPQKN